MVLSVLACTAGFALSWPYWRDFEYWGESPSMWWAYFMVGFVLSVYVFHAFLNSLRTLFLHDELEKAGLLPKGKPAQDPKTDEP